MKSVSVNDNEVTLLADKSMSMHISDWAVQNDGPPNREQTTSHVEDAGGVAEAGVDSETPSDETAGLSQVPVNTDSDGDVLINDESHESAHQLEGDNEVQDTNITSTTSPVNPSSSSPANESSANASTTNASDRNHDVLTTLPSSSASAPAFPSTPANVSAAFLTPEILNYLHAVSPASAWQNLLAEFWISSLWAS